MEGQLSFRRISAACGLLAAALFLVVSLIPPGPLSLASSLERVVEYFQGNYNSLLGRSTFHVVSYAFFTVFAVGLWTVTGPDQRRRGEGWGAVGLFATISSSVLSVVSASSVVAVTIWTNERLFDPNTAYAIYVFGTSVAAFAGALVAVGLVGYMLAGVRSGLFGSTVVIVGALVVISGIVGMGAATTTFTSFFATVGFIGGFLLAIWTALVSWQMSRDTTPIAETDASEAVA